MLKAKTALYWRFTEVFLDLLVSRHSSINRHAIRSIGLPLLSESIDWICTCGRHVVSVTNFMLARKISSTSASCTIIRWLRQFLDGKGFFFKLFSLVTGESVTSYNVNTKLSHDLDALLIQMLE